GTAAVVIVLAGALVTRNPWFLFAAPVAGYGFAWIGHFVFEKNRPATFQYPWYSLLRFRVVSRRADRSHQVLARAYERPRYRSRFRAALEHARELTRAGRIAAR